MNTNSKQSLFQRFKVSSPVLPQISKFNDPPSPKIDTLKKCINCKKMFNPKKNNECRYHSEIGSVGLRVRNGYDEIYYKCCGEIEKGFFPTYISNGGCQIKEKHISEI